MFLLPVILLALILVPKFRAGFWKKLGFYGDLKRQQEAFDESKQKSDQEKVGALIEKAAVLAKQGKVLIKKIEK